MKPTLVSLALLLSAAPALAEWTELGGSEQVTFYADPATLASAEGTASMWTLVNLKRPRRNGEVSFSSIRARFEFDCPGQRVRELESHFHAGEMAAGAEVAGSTEAGVWEALTEGTVKHEVARLACKKD